MNDFEFIYDKMFYEEKKYPPEVRWDDDGFFRWRYKLDNYHDMKEYSLMIKIFAVISLGGFVGGMLYGGIGYALIGFAILFGIFMLIVGLVRLIDGGSALRWYRMNNEIVQIQPSGRGSGVTFFSSVKKVFFDPVHNEIKLSSSSGPAYIMMRREDYELLKIHVLNCIPENAEVIYVSGN